MAWETPKTDWAKGDSFDLNPDYERIRGNILQLQADAAPLYKSKIPLADMPDYAISDVPLAGFFNAIERNVEAIAQHTIAPIGGYVAGKTWEANKPIWAAADLNRIEDMIRREQITLDSQAQNRTKLAFVFGGGLLG